MKEIKHVLKDPLGIHARPAGQLVKIAGKYTCDIQIALSSKSANVKRIIAVMALAIKHGDEITLTFSGEDEEAAAAEVTKFLEENL